MLLRTGTPTAQLRMSTQTDFAPGRAHRLDYAVELLPADKAAGVTIVTAILRVAPKFGDPPIFTKQVTTVFDPANGQITDNAASDGKGALYILLNENETGLLSTKAAFELTALDSMGRESPIDHGAIFATKQYITSQIASVRLTGDLPLTGPVGSTFQLIAKAYDLADAEIVGIAFSWASNAPAIASVSVTGVVTFIAAGEATISAIAQTNGPASASTTAIVDPQGAEGDIIQKIAGTWQGAPLGDADSTVKFGDGSPHGVVTAPRGKIYVDRQRPRTAYIALADGNKNWARIFDDVHAKAYVTDLVDGSGNLIDVSSQLSQADAAAAAVGAYLYMDPVGTYLVAPDFNFTARVKFPLGAVIKRGASGHILFTKGYEAGDYQIFDNTARGVGRFDCIPGTVDMFRFRWWNIQGNNYSIDESALVQDMFDQLHNGAKITATVGQLIRCDYRVRNTKWAQDFIAPKNMMDPNNPSVQLRYGGPASDNGILVNFDHTGIGHWEGFGFEQLNAESALNFEMSKVSAVAASDLIVAEADLGICPWTFAPFDVGKQLQINEVGTGGGTHTCTITSFVTSADPSYNGVPGSQVRVTPAPVVTHTQRGFDLNTGTLYGYGQSIATAMTFTSCRVNMWGVQDRIDVQGVCIARSSGSNNELHRFHQCDISGFDRIERYGYRIYNNSGVTASMTAGDNLVTLSSAPTSTGALTGDKVGMMFRIGGCGAFNDAPLTVAAPGGVIGGTTIPVLATTQFIPNQGKVRLGGFMYTVNADVPVGSTSLPVFRLGGVIPAGTTGDDQGHFRRSPNNDLPGQLQCTITSIVNDHQFRVNANASANVAGMMCVINRNRGRAFLIGPSFNVHQITFSGSCNLSGCWRGMVCYGGGFHFESVINIGANDCNIEIGGNNAHPMLLGFINSENSLQHLISTTGSMLEIRGRISGESTAPGKAILEFPSGPSGLTMATAIVGALDDYAKTGGSTIFDVHATAGMTMLLSNIDSRNILGDPIDEQRTGLLDTTVNQGYVECVNALGFQHKLFGLEFNESPVRHMGGASYFRLPQINSSPSLKFEEMGFRRGADTAVYLDSWMSFGAGVQTLPLRPRVVKDIPFNGYSPAPADVALRVTLDAFNSWFVSLYKTGSGALPAGWECTFKRIDANATHFDISAGEAGVTINGAASYRLDGLGASVRLVHFGNGIFETVA